ncbi:AMP-binding protein [Streptomyces johnsoniae]|uniref:AMP-binding protein n=1 Tax=Streptomyces johnsoniae TaxID=3075532 RepID=A0ABU2S7X8_9ACTN|nr:AMP-binding protein [Streptomyces sp. DSM 41886]MDT0444514.1 AMP-binding protein [Streptomyces sp. DSM 41886]
MNEDSSETTDARFSAVARAHPQLPALHEGGTTLTYGELDAASDEVARQVRAHAAPGTPVGVRMPRCAGHVAAILGIWKAGSACVPVAPGLTGAQADGVLQAGGATALVGAGGAVLPLPARPAEAGGGPRLADNDGSRDPTAYVFFTSGSTGAPKGVAIPHRGVLNEADWTHRAFSLIPGDRGTWLSSPGFAISRWELWPSLTRGASVVIADEGVEWNAPTAQRWLLDHRAATTILVTGLGERMLGLAWPERCALRLMVLGGEQLRRWPGTVPFTVVNSYGITEVSGARLTAVLDAEGEGLPPIGRPIANTWAHVLDPQGVPVPPGDTGELYLGGTGLAHGYVGNPRLTAERFLPDPFRGGDARMYRTGDLVREASNGELCYVARAGADPKVGGARVDLAEVEAALLRHPDVDWAAAAVDESAGTKELIAYVGCAAGPEPSPHALRALLAGRLPRHAVPTRYFRLAAPPRLISGKLDRSALPGPEGAKELTDPFAAPVSATERAVLRLFLTALPDTRIGVLDDFFALGGDSYGLSRLRAALEREFGREIALADLYTARSVRDVARLVGTTAPAAQDGPDEAPAAGRPESLPLSGIQRGIWLEQQDDPASPAYLETVALHLGGEPDLGALQSAVAEVVAGQDLLRAGVETSGPEPALAVRPTACAVLPVLDASRTADGGPAEPGTAELARPFDLARGPLFRLLLRRFSRTEHVLTFLVHHLVWDGASADVLLDELTAAYERALGRPVVPGSPGSYHAYVTRERRALAGSALPAAVAHWRDVLADVPPSNPAFAGPGPAGAAQGTLGVLSWTPEPGLVARVRRAAAGAGTTVSVLGAVAFAAALRRHGAGRAPVVLTPVSLRRPAEERTIGPYLNMIPLVVPLPDDVPGETVLRDTAARLAAGLAHAAVPFTEVVRALQPPRRNGEAPWGQFLFEANRLPKRRVTSDAVTWRAEWLPGRAPKFRLAMMWNEDEDGWHCRLEYDARRLDAATADRFLVDVERHTRLLADTPRAPLPPVPPQPATAAATGPPAAAGAAPAARAPAERRGDEGEVRAYLARAWTSVLQTDDVEDEDNFIVMGGASLEAARLLAGVRSRFGVRIPTRELFDSENFADFVDRVARAISRRDGAGDEQEVRSNA